MKIYEVCVEELGSTWNSSGPVTIARFSKKADAKAFEDQLTQNNKDRCTTYFVKIVEVR